MMNYHPLSRECSSWCTACPRYHDTPMPLRCWSSHMGADSARHQQAAPSWSCFCPQMICKTNSISCCITPGGTLQSIHSLPESETTDRPMRLSTTSVHCVISHAPYFSPAALSDLPRLLCKSVPITAAEEG